MVGRKHALFCYFLNGAILAKRGKKKKKTEQKTKERAEERIMPCWEVKAQLWI